MKKMILAMLCAWMILSGCAQKPMTTIQITTASGDEIEMTLRELEGYTFRYDETLEYAYLYHGENIKAICSFLNIERFEELKQSIEKESQEEETFFTVVDSGEKQGNEYFTLSIDKQSDESALNLHYLQEMEGSNTYVDLMFIGTVDTIAQAQEILDALTIAKR